MESFQQKYTDRCKVYDIEPLQALTDRLQTVNNNKENSQRPDELHLNGTTLNIKMCKALADTLQSDTGFTVVNLADTLMGDDGCVLISNALKNHAIIRSLDLRGNNLRSDAAVALSQLLKVNCSLQSLSLEWNCLGIWELGINALAESLSVNQSLESLDLRNNKVGPQGASVLAQGLKHNTFLKRLDLRWNNIGLIGGRAFLELLKWNKTLLHLDLSGNEVPDDALRAIDLALERNREAYRNLKEASNRAQYLSSTVQQMTNEHEQAVHEFRSKLLTQETGMQALHQKLDQSSREVEQSHMAYRVLENKITEERVRRENIEKKCLDLETTLAQERRDHSDRMQALLSDLMNERGNRVRQEEAYRYQISQMTEKQLVHESGMKEVQLKLELLQREKVTLMEEMEKMRANQQQLQKIHDEQLRQLALNKRESDQAYRRELREMQDEFSSKLKDTETERHKMDEMAENYRQRSMEWDAKMKAMEKQIRMEENTRRQELIAKMQSLAQHRESLQQSLNAHLQTHRQTVVDYEARLTRERESQQSFHGKVADLTHERDEAKSELNRLRDRSARWDEIEREWKARNERMEEENTKLKSDLARLERVFDRIRDEEVQRAKELEKAVTGYVRSVERSSVNPVPGAQQ